MSQIEVAVNEAMYYAILIYDQKESRLEWIIWLKFSASWYFKFLVECSLLVSILLFECN